MLRKKLYLSDGQRAKIKTAINQGRSVDLRIDPSKRSNATLLLTSCQTAKFQEKKPFNLSLSATQLRETKRGGFIVSIPAAIAAIGAAASLAGGASAIAKAVNDKKSQDKMLAETRRHNKAMEKKKGKGLYLKPYRK